ncbi:MAG TPA: hypothetical protein VGL51_02745 [Solirubrobacteraceae bacterium]|jgi:hypothetical protein
MLASITPLGERGRHGHWTITAAAFLLGAVAAGIAVGAALGALGALLVSGLGDSARLTTLAVALLAAAVLDAGPWRVLGPRRQVDERWLDRYRGWVYGLGYGAQLGAGTVTVVTSAATYGTLLAALLTADPGRGALIAGAYGAIRGLTPLATARVHTPAQLLAFHARFQRVGGRAAWIGVAALAGGVVLAALGSAW